MLGPRIEKKSIIVLENPDLLTAIWGGGSNSKIPFFDKYPHFGVFSTNTFEAFPNTEDISIYHDHELLSDETFASSPEKHSP